jgi:hypothetical protein
MSLVVRCSAPAGLGEPTLAVDLEPGASPSLADPGMFEDTSDPGSPELCQDAGFEETEYIARFVRVCVIVTAIPSDCFEVSTGGIQRV